jgi:hypothetical protein
MELILLASHMFGDFITQTDWMASNKFINWKARLFHVSVYTLGFVPIPFIAHMKLISALLFLGLIFITHFITDCRRWVSGEKWAPKPIVVDQTIHVITLAILALIFKL